MKNAKLGPSSWALGNANEKQNVSEPTEAEPTEAEPRGGAIYTFMAEDGLMQGLDLLGWWISQQNVFVWMGRIEYK